jgi:hypothetical protein
MSHRKASMFEDKGSMFDDIASMSEDKGSMFDVSYPKKT